MLSMIAKAGISILVIGILVLILPFSISLPVELVDFFKGGAIQNIVNILHFFFPIDFLIGSLIFLYSVKYLGIFMNIISWIYHKVLE